jgi:uncharacterized protein (TIGR02646 family)
MKQINKADAPAFFSDFVRKKKPHDWDEIKEIRNELREHILREQSGCCAYTELRVGANGHIDHYKKQALFPQFKFDYRNLLVADSAEEYGAKYKDKHIKAGDYDNLINPAVDNPMNYLEFTYTGEVVAKNGSPKGQTTIDIFNLNDRNLVRRRVACLLQMTEYMHEFSVKEVTDFFQGEFSSMIGQLYNNA